MTDLSAPELPASSPGGAPVPPDAVPPGTVPPGTVPPGTVPAGTVPAGTVPAGTVAAGTVAAGTLAPPESGRAAGRAVVSGGSWALLPQLTSLAVNLGLTPFVLHGLGVERYGLFLFATTVAQFVGSFDGGITMSAQRFLSTFAGARDKVATTRLVVTMTLVGAVFGALVFGLMWLVAPPLTAELHMPAALREEGTFLLRTLGVLVGVAVTRNVVSAVLIAYQRFVYVAVVSSVLYAEYAVGLVLTVHHHWGLQGVAWTLVVQQVAVTLLFVPATLPYLSRRGIGLYRLAELRRFLSYSGKVQLVGLANLFLQEADVLLIGAVLPIRSVAIYAVGANFALQLRLVPVNALQPMLSVLGQTLGRSGRDAMVEQFQQVQRSWVAAVSGWCVVGAAAIGFGLTAWLGDGFTHSGIVGVIVLLGNLFYLGPSVLLLLLGLLDRPGEEARFSGVMVAANVLLTVPLVFVGPIGVAAATAAGQLVAALWLVRRVRRVLDVPVASFLRQVPVVPCLVTAAMVTAVEILLRPLVPHGPGGLLVSAVPAGLGLLLYAVLVLGVTRTRTYAGRGGATLRRRLGGRTA